MTTAGFVAATRDETTPNRRSRVAATLSVLLGTTLVAVLPAVIEAAFYAGVLVATCAAGALTAGCMLWSRATMLVRALVAFSAGATLLAQLFQLLEGLPGARELAPAAGWGSRAAFALACAVLVSLLVDARHRRLQHPQDHPYAL